MLLNWEEIKKKKIFEDGTFSEANFTAANYNLSIKGFIVIDNKPQSEEIESFFLEPRGMVVAVSNEIFDMPNDVVGYTTVKNALSLKGVMAINVGIVDPLYKGPISSALINFGKEKIELKKGDTFLRMTFHEFKKGKEINPFAYNFDETQYWNKRKIDAYEYLDETFLNMKSIYKDVYLNIKEKKEEEDKIFYRKLTSIGILISSISLAIALLVFVINIITKQSENKRIEEKIINIERQLDNQRNYKTIINENKLFTIDSLKMQSKSDNKINNIKK